MASEQEDRVRRLKPIWQSRGKMTYMIAGAHLHARNLIDADMAIGE